MMCLDVSDRPPTRRTSRRANEAHLVSAATVDEYEDRPCRRRFQGPACMSTAKAATAAHKMKMPARAVRGADRLRGEGRGEGGEGLWADVREKRGEGLKVA